MADRVEREIEEILSKLDDLPGDGGKGRTPVPIASRRRPAPTPAARASRGPGLLDRLSPASMMITGAVVMMGGLLAAAFVDSLIWLAYAGVVLFLAAFLTSFFRSSRGGAPARPRGMYWRDRYIEYEPSKPGALERFRQRFRRR